MKHSAASSQRRGIAIEAMTERAMDFAVAVPTWGVGTGGTRFARFPGPGEPRNIHDKLEDCGVIQQLTRATPNVSPHFPWDKVSDYNALRQEAALAQPGLRRGELQHLPGPEGPAALLQVRLADPCRQGHAAAGCRAQSRMHRDRAEARLHGAHRVDRRRLELSRPGQSQRRLRPLHRVAAGPSTTRCRRTGSSSSSTSSTSPPSIRR